MTESIEARLENSLRKLFQSQSKTKRQDIKLEEYNLSENERKIVESYEKTHSQLAPLAIFEFSALLESGIGIFVVMPMGSGKSAVLKSLSDVFSDGLKIDSTNVIKEKAFEISNKQTKIFVDDINTIIYGLEGGVSQLSIITQLIFAREYRDSEITIENADVSVLVNGTYDNVRTLGSEGLWKNQIVERFARIYYFYYAPPKKFSSSPPKFPDIDIYDGKDMKWKIDENRMSKAVNLFCSQFSEQRAYRFAKLILSGHARLCNRDEVNDDDFKWLQLYRPFISIEPMLMSKRIEIGDSEITMNKTLAESFFIITKEIGRDIDDIVLKSKMTSYKFDSILERIESLLGVRIKKEEGKIVDISGDLADRLKHFHNTWKI